MSKRKKADTWCRAAKDFAIGLFICLVVMLIALTDGEAAKARVAHSKHLSPLFMKAQPSGSTLLFVQALGATEPTLATLVKSQAEVQVSGVLARGVITQHYRLPHGRIRNAAIVFPLGRHGFVDGLRIASENGQPIDVALWANTRSPLPRVPRNRKALASELAARLPEAFVASVPKVAGNQTIAIQISFQRFANAVNDGYELSLPIAPATGGPIPLQVNARINAGLALAEASTSEYFAEIDLNRNKHAGVRVNRAFARAGQPFTLRWRPEPAPWPRATLFRENAAEAEHVMVVVTPPSQHFAPQSPPRQVIYVLDRLDMISADRRAALITALVSASRKLRNVDTFNVIITARGHPRRLFRSPVRAGRANLALMHRFLAAHADTKGGEFSGALEAALNEQPSSDPTTVRQILILSDGWTEGSSEIIKLTQTADNRTRVFVVNAGDGPANLLLHRASMLGRGAYLDISPGRWSQQALQDFMATLASPMLIGPRITWPKGVRAEAAPEALPDVSGTEPIVAVARVSSLRGGLVLQGDLKAENWKTRLGLASAEPGAGIAKFWAQERLQQLAFRTLVGQDQRAVAEVARQLTQTYRLPTANDVRSARIGHDGERLLAPLFGMSTEHDHNVTSNERSPNLHANVDGLTQDLPIFVSQPISSSNGIVAWQRSSSSENSILSQGPDHRREVNKLETVDSTATTWPFFSEKLVTMIILSLAFATMCAVTLGFWRHLRRQYNDNWRAGGQRLG